MNALHELLGVGAPQPDKIEHCPKHGDYTSRNLFSRVWSCCPTCAKEDQQARDAARLEESRDAAKSHWLKRLGQSEIPPRFLDKTFARFNADNDGQRYARDQAEAFAAAFIAGQCPAHSLLFVGQTGTGKTHLACAVALRVMKQGGSAMFTTAARMIRRIREAKSFSAAETESEAIRLHTFPDLLILDEVGVQSGTDAEARALFEVINERHEQCKPTIYISNFDVGKVADALGPRIHNRLLEDGAQLVSFDWESLRGKLPA